MTTFLALNGWEVAMSDERLAELILGYAHGIEPEEMADELRALLVPRT